MNRTVLAVLLAGLLVVPPAAAHDEETDNPFHDDYHDHCPPGDRFGDDTECTVYEAAWFLYGCGLWVVEEGPETVYATAREVADLLLPTVRKTKCAAKNGTEDDRRWFNEDVHEWYNRWFCYTVGGPNHCGRVDRHPHDATRHWLLCNLFGVAPLLDQPDEINCPEEGAYEWFMDRRPPATPGKPPYP